MAMIKCPECGREVANRTLASPTFAYPIAEEKTLGLVRIKMNTLKDIGISGNQKVTGF